MVRHQPPTRPNQLLLLLRDAVGLDRRGFPGFRLRPRLLNGGREGGDRRFHLAEDSLGSSPAVDQITLCRNPGGKLLRAKSLPDRSPP